MKKNQDNSLFFKIFSSKIFFFIFLLIVIYLSINVCREIKQRLEVKKEIADLREEIANLSNENNQLNDLIEYFKTEEYVESVAREKLGYQKSGEKIVVFTEEDENIIQGEEERGEELEDRSNLKLWWDYFFNNI